MAKQTLFIILAIVICLQRTWALQFVWGMNATLNALCPATGYTTVTDPAEECNLKKYVMCSNGQAIAINNCRHPLRFNNEKGWCDVAENVPTPAACQSEDSTPQTCGQGAMFVPVTGSCKKYKWCLPNGDEVEMMCPYLSYYVHEKQRCMFTTKPYVQEIPNEFLSRCLQTDPFTPVTTQATIEA